MNFFQDQARYRRRSLWQVGLFLVSVLATVALVDVLVAGLYNGFFFFIDRPWVDLSWTAIRNLTLFQLTIIVGACAWRIYTLRRGGASVALDLGGTPVPVGTDNPSWQRLRNVVAEVAIASGTPVLNVFVMEFEPGINAFAAGYTPSDAAICVTQGCLDRLTRDEMQGVIAHEFTHVVNGDIRLNMRLVGLLYGIVGAGVLGHNMIEGGMGSASRNRLDDNSVPALFMLAGIALVTYGAAGSLCGRLVQAAVARTREMLADASAVQFTRQTEGLAGALKKIAALYAGSRLHAPARGEVAHMLLGDGGRGGGWFATHPPIAKRLHALGHPLTARGREAIAKAWQHPAPAQVTDSPLASLSGFMPVGASAQAAAARTPAPALRPAPKRHWLDVPDRSLGDAVGAPLAEDFDLAAIVRERMPPALLRAAEDPDQVVIILLALLLDAQPDVREKQHAIMLRMLDAAQAQRALRGRELLADLDPLARLPLAALAFPALRRQPRPQLRHLLAVLQALAGADLDTSLHEYCLLRLLRQQLRDLLDPARGFRPGRRRLYEEREALAEVCSIVAAHGHRGDRDAAQRAFVRGLHAAMPGWEGGFDPPQRWQPVLTRALARLDAVRATGKQLVVEALAATISADGEVTVAESELLHLLCAVLHCPLPLLAARPAD